MTADTSYFSDWMSILDSMGSIGSSAIRRLVMVMMMMVMMVMMMVMVMVIMMMMVIAMAIMMIMVKGSSLEDASQ